MPTQAQIIAKANDRVREWLSRRIDADSLDIARLYKGSRDRLMMKLRGLYDSYLAEEPTYVRARQTGTLTQMQKTIDMELDTLTDEVGQRAVAKTAEILNIQSNILDKQLGRHFARKAFEDLPISTRQVLGELTTNMVGGATFEDRLFHASDLFKRDLHNGLRRGLITGKSFDDIRKDMMKSFGVDKLGEPKYNAYGSVKIYKNEARRQWNMLMKKQGERGEGKQVWWAMIDDPDVTPGCAARHGMDIDEDLDGDVPPRHYNSFHPSTRIRCEAVLGFRRLYQGRMLRLVTRQGYTLTVTPQHPILTTNGLRPAEILRKGDYILCSPFWNDGQATDEQDIPPTIEQAFETLSRRGAGHRSVQTSTDDFHGDSTAGNGYVDIVAVNRELLDYITESSMLELVRQFPFILTNSKLSLLNRNRSFTFSAQRITHATPGNPHGMALTLDKPRIQLQLPPFQSLSFGLATKLDAMFSETSSQYTTRDTTFATELEHRHASEIFRDELIEIVDFNFSGHVYDLQSVSGLLVAENLITSNCRCTVAVFPPDEDLSIERKMATARLARMGYTKRDAMFEEAWDPSQHPRDDDGKFTGGGGSSPEDAKTWADDAGGKFDGIQERPRGQEPLVLITDKKTGSTGAIPLSQLTKASVKAKVDEIRGRSKEVGWGWGHEILQPIARITDDSHRSGYSYRSVHWRALPREAAGLVLDARWVSSLRAGVSGDTPDRVLLRTNGKITEVKSWRGWIPLDPRGVMIETAQGIVDDSAVIQPPWDLTVQRLPLDVRQRWPMLVRLSVPVQMEYVLALVSKHDAEQLTIGVRTLQLGEYMVGDDLGVTLSRLLWQTGHPAEPHLVIATSELSLRIIVNITTGEVIYATDNFVSPLCSPYTRVAAAVLERDGRIWAIMPRGLARWVLPGGHIDAGESPRDAVVREMLEETGQHIRVERLLGTLYRPWSNTLIFLCRHITAHRAWHPSAETDAVMQVNWTDLALDERLFLERHGVKARWENQPA